MILNDQSVLEPLQLEVADLSSFARFIREAAAVTPEGEDPVTSTSSVLKARGILPGLAGPRLNEAVVGNAPPPPTATRQIPEAGRGQSVVWVPVVPMSRDGFEVLQRFDGTVLSAEGDAFIARLQDKTNAGPEEEAEIPVAEVMPGDRALIRPGAMFYWVIGYRREAHGQVSRSSFIRFRRLPSWSSADIERAKREARTFLSFLDLDRANHPA